VPVVDIDANPDAMSETCLLRPKIRRLEGFILGNHQPGVVGITSLPWRHDFTCKSRYSRATQVLPVTLFLPSKIGAVGLSGVLTLSFGSGMVAQANPAIGCLHVEAVGGCNGGGHREAILFGSRARHLAIASRICCRWSGRPKNSSAPAATIASPAAD